MQIRRISLRERRKIRKRNRKQINAEDDVNDPRVLAVLAMINLNPHILTRELQRNLEIPYVTVWRILQRHKFHPYHITLTQDVNENEVKKTILSLGITNDKRRSNFFPVCSLQ
ncbi:hypothetical protein P5V15_002578 [Pogonomyrmex californicus]